MKTTIYNIEATLENQRLMTICDIVKAEIDFNRLISDREGQIRRRLSSMRCEFHFDDLPMGSGGVGQIKEMNDGTIRIQIGYGKGRYNYARTLVVK